VVPPPEIAPGHAAIQPLNVYDVCEVGVLGTSAEIERWDGTRDGQISLQQGD
jgi:hypothetical protein